MGRRIFHRQPTQDRIISERIRAKLERHDVLWGGAMNMKEDLHENLREKEEEV